MFIFLGKTKRFRPSHLAVGQFAKRREQLLAGSVSRFRVYFFGQPITMGKVNSAKIRDYFQNNPSAAKAAENFLYFNRNLGQRRY